MVQRRARPSYGVAVSIYAVSDIHGCYNKYLALIGALRPEDTLYVLGDVIDRGRGGAAILSDMAGRKNVFPLIGNHESLALPMLKAIRDGSPYRASKAYRIWLGIGGGATERAFVKLSKEEQSRITEYVSLFSVYERITVNGRSFHLSHTLPPFDPARPLHDCPHLEFIWGEADYGACYGEGTLFVTGHRPTALIDPAYSGRILKRGGHIAIDCGAAFADAGGRLGCLRLDDLEEIYY